MNLISHKTVAQTIKYFGHIAEYLKIPVNEEGNDRLLELARQLKAQLKSKKDATTAELLDIVLDHIEAYEKRAYPLRSMKPTEILLFLMEQHQLSQRDLPEIGSQSHVSKILHEKRQLTLDQIATLSERFGISPAVFFSVKKN
jgi:HTH-type transcriptional regulator / antitoxin HigA